VLEAGDAADGFSRDAVDSDGIEVISLAFGDSDGRHGRVEDLAVGILDQQQIPDPAGGQSLGRAR